MLDQLNDEPTCRCQRKEHFHNKYAIIILINKTIASEWKTEFLFDKYKYKRKALYN